MADESLPQIQPKVEMGVVPPSTPEQVAATRKINENFLAVLAINDANVVMRNQIGQENPELVVKVVDNYIANIRRSSEGYSQQERVALVKRLCGVALEGVSLDYADLFKSRLRDFINEQVETKEVGEVISAEELDVMFENVTDETVSPPRGLAIEKIRAAIQSASARLMGIVS